jgi:hypothetical protein
VSGDARFHALLAELAELHDRKQMDYGQTHDPFANVRATEEWGMPAWVGAMMRLNDKVRRLQKFAQVGSLANESAEDSMRDIAVYALIALILYRESAAGQPGSSAPNAATYLTWSLPDQTSSDGVAHVGTGYITTRKFARTAGTGTKGE